MLPAIPSCCRLLRNIGNRTAKQRDLLREPLGVARLVCRDAQKFFAELRVLHLFSVRGVALHILHLFDIARTKDFDNIAVAVRRNPEKFPPPIRPALFVSHKRYLPRVLYSTI